MKSRDAIIPVYRICLGCLITNHLLTCFPQLSHPSQSLGPAFGPFGFHDKTESDYIWVPPIRTTRVFGSRTAM